MELLLFFIYLQFDFVFSQIPPGQPQVDGTQTFILGNEYTVSCTSTGGVPTPSVLWYRGQNQITTGTQTTNTTNSVTTTLTFTVTKADHLAIFRCEADNGVLQNALTTTVFVYVNFVSQPPTITGPTNLVADNSGTWTCTAVDGYPAPTMTTRIGNNLFTNGFTTSNQYVTSTQSYTVTGTLVWSPSVANNGQSICCDVTNAVVSSTPQTVCLQLTVRFLAPLFVFAPTTQYNPTIGTTVTLTCNVTSGTATGISWTKDGNTLTIGSNTRYSGGSVSTPSLTISGVVQSDGGNYVCQATDETATVNTNTINVAPQGLLTVTVSPSNNTVILGTSSVTIQCTIQGTNQATSWEWTKTPINGGTQTVIAQGTNDGHLQVVNSATNPNLTISNIVAADEAIYRCRANNGAGQVTSQSSTLVVNGELPTISVEPSQYTGTIGDVSYQIQCTVTAVPSATSWFWTFTPLSGGAAITIQQGTNNQDYLMDSSNTKPHLTIKNLAKADEGDYRCFATNLAGTGQSSASRLNMAGDILSVTISPDTANVIRGNTQTVTCSVSGTPAANSISWTKDGSTLNVANSGGKYSGGTTGNPSLTINNFQTTDAGTYSCSATNAAGTGSSLPKTSVLTYVGTFETVLTIGKTEYSIIYGDSVQLECKVSSGFSFQSIYWKIEMSEFSKFVNSTTDITKYSGSTISNPSLVVIDTTYDDEGYYTCFGSNSTGKWKSQTAFLKVNINAKEEASNTVNIIIGVTVASVLICILVVTAIVCYKKGFRIIKKSSVGNKSIELPQQQREIMQYQNADERPVINQTNNSRHYYDLEPGTMETHVYNPAVTDDNEHYITLPADVPY